jgi:hypothetical protein
MEVNQLEPNQVEKLVFEAIVVLYKQGKELVSMGEVCEFLGLDKDNIPSLYYQQYYELADFYKDHPDVGLEQLNNTIH